MNLSAVSKNLAAVSAELQAKVARPLAIQHPTINPELLQVFRDWGVNGLLTQLRDYCHLQGESSFDSGYTGTGWYEMHDRIDNIIPAGRDAELDGEMRGRDVDYLEVNARWGR
jgi:hypothetical protein